MTARIRASYSVPEIARMLDYSVQRARRYLRRRGVELPQGKGVRAVIPLTVLLKKIGDDLDSAAFVQRLRPVQDDEED